MKAVAGPAPPAVMILILLAGVAVAQDTAAKWIWYPEDAPHDAREQSRFFRYTFDLRQAPEDATLWLMVDDSQKLWVNGEGPRAGALAADSKGTARVENPGWICEPCWNWRQAPGSERARQSRGAGRVFPRLA